MNEPISNKTDLRVGMLSLSEKAQFEREMEEMLANVRDQDFIFDLEGVLINTI